MSMPYDPNSFGGFTPAVDPMGPQALLRRRQKAVGGGMDQSAFEDPMGLFFSLVQKQLQAPPMTNPGAPQVPGYRPGTEANPYGRVDTSVRGVSGAAASGKKPGFQDYNWFNFNERTMQSKMYSKYGNVQGAPLQNTTYGQRGLMNIGEAPAPDYTNLINYSNQAFNGDQGAATDVLRQLQKDIGSGQQMAGTFESQAGAAAGGAAGAAFLNQLKAILAPQLVQAAQTPQGQYIVPTVNGNVVPQYKAAGAQIPISYNGNGTVLQALAAKAAAGQNVPQLKTNFLDQGAVYAR